MEELFELMTEKGGESEKEPRIRVGIRMKVWGFETLCSVTEACNSYDALEREIQGIRKGLDLILTRAEKVLKGSRLGSAWDPHVPAEEIWAALSGMNEDIFAESFNNMEEGRRREVAEYVLTHCNIFSGNARIFSQRYNEESALMN